MKKGKTKGKTISCPECGSLIPYWLGQIGSSFEVSLEQLRVHEYRIKNCPECGERVHIVDHA